MSVGGTAGKLGTAVLATRLPVGVPDGARPVTGLLLLLGLFTGWLLGGWLVGGWLLLGGLLVDGWLLIGGRWSTGCWSTGCWVGCWLSACWTATPSGCRPATGSGWIGAPAARRRADAPPLATARVTHRVRQPCWPRPAPPRPRCRPPAPRRSGAGRAAPARTPRCGGPVGTRPRRRPRRTVLLPMPGRGRRRSVRVTGSDRAICRAMSSSDPRRTRPLPAAVMSSRSARRAALPSHRRCPDQLGAADSSCRASVRSPRWVAIRTAPGRLPSTRPALAASRPMTARNSTASAWSAGSAATSCSAAAVDIDSAAAPAVSSGPAVALRNSAG